MKYAPCAGLVTIQSKKMRLSNILAYVVSSSLFNGLVDELRR